MVDVTCKEKCLCGDCVRNPHYCINTPDPCIGADCDICDFADCVTCFCNHHLTIEEVNKRVAEMRKGE